MLSTRLVMNNEKLVRFFELLRVCERIQNRLLTQERNMQHNYVIVNMYRLATEHPMLPPYRLLTVYRTLLKSSCTFGSVEIPLDEKNVFVARSLCFQ